MTKYIFMVSIALYCISSFAYIIAREERLMTDCKPTSFYTKDAQPIYDCSEAEK